MASHDFSTVSTLSLHVAIRSFQISEFDEDLSFEEVTTAAFKIVQLDTPDVKFSSKQRKTIRKTFTELSSVAKSIAELEQVCRDNGVADRFEAANRNAESAPIEDRMVEIGYEGSDDESENEKESEKKPARKPAKARKLTPEEQKAAEEEEEQRAREEEERERLEYTSFRREVLIMPAPTIIAQKEYIFVTEDMLVELYDFVNHHIDDLTLTVEAGLFQGFNREKIMSESFAQLSHQAIFVIATLTAIRGPAKFATDPDIGGITVMSAGLHRQVRVSELYSNSILKSEKNKQANKKLLAHDLTAGRICSAFPDVAAFGLYALSQRGLIDKRIAGNSLPSWMQFTQAASLPMQEAWRRDHVKFSKAFSKLIGGTFKPEIYAQQSRQLIDLSSPLGEVLTRASGGSLVVAMGENFSYDTIAAEEAAAEEKKTAEAAQAKTTEAAAAK